MGTSASNLVLLVELCVPSPNLYVEILTPSTSKRDLLGNKVIADAISRGHQALKQQDCRPYKQATGAQNTHTTRIPCEQEGRDWGDASTSQDTLRTATTPRRWERAAHGLSRTAAEGSKPANTLSSDFQPPRPRDNTLLLLEPPVCGTSVQWPSKQHT